MQRNTRQTGVAMGVDLVRKEPAWMTLGAHCVDRLIRFVVVLIPTIKQKERGGFKSDFF